MSVALAPSTDIPESAAFTTVEVKWVRHWDDRLFSFSVERPASFRFRSGEFVMIGLPGEAKPVMRAYSIASPAWSDELEFLSIKVEGGPLTDSLQKLEVGHRIYMGKKPVGTLVLDALTPGKRLFMLGTGTGLAPFLSVARDPDVYQCFDDVILAHGVRKVSELAWRELLSARLGDDPLISEEAATKFHYVPTVTREDFERTGRITALIDDGRLFDFDMSGPKAFDPATDRIMLCGSMEMIKELAALLDARGFTEGSNHKPGDYVIERAFVD